MNEIAERSLADLTSGEVAAARTLAFLGPVVLSTAVDVVDADVIYALEERGLVDVIETRDGPLIAVGPPIVAEFLRHESPPGRRFETLARIDSSLEHSLQEHANAALSPDDIALFVRLAHERTRRRVLAAREEWRRSPGLAAAALLLRALGADSTHSGEEVESLIADAAPLSGSPMDHAEWETAYAVHLAHDRRRAADAIKRLRHAAAEFPSVAPRLISEALVLDIEWGEIPATDELRDVAFHRLADESRVPAVLARAYWLLVRGQIVEADSLLSEHAALEVDDPRLHAALVYAKLGLGEYARAAEIARHLAANARAAFDAPRMRIYAFLTAISSVFTRELGAVEHHIAFADSLGVPAMQAPSSSRGLVVLSGYLAVKRGQRAAAAQSLADLDATGLSDGLLPGLHRSLVEIRRARLDGDLVRAAAAGRRAGDELWERGALFGAAFAYLDGLRARPDRAAWTHAAPRLRQVDSPVIRRWASFTEALVSADAAAVVRVVSEAERNGDRVEAAEMAATALTELAGQRSMTSAHRDALTRISQESLGSRAREIVELTTREREVAELIAAGLSNPMIAEALVLSVRTVESHVNRLMRKIGARERTDIRDYLIDIGPR